MNESVESRPSSLVDDTYQFPKENQLTAGTWSVVLPVLIVALIVLKSFIYIKDGDRHGK